MLHRIVGLALVCALVGCSHPTSRPAESTPSLKAPTYTLCQTPPDGSTYHGQPSGSTLGVKADGSWWYFAATDAPGTYPPCPDEAYVHPVPSATEAR